MNLSINPELSIASQRIAEDFEAFIARGGQVETLPRGAMAETGWTGRQLLNPQVHTKAMREADFAEREARKLAKRSEPAPRGTERPVRVKAPKPPKPPKPPRVRPAYVKTGRPMGRPRAAEGTKARAIIDLLSTGPRTSREIAEANGWNVKLTAVTVQKMGERGSLKRVARIHKPGVSHCVIWGVA